MASAAEPEEQWLDTPDPQPRLGWYKDTHTGRIYFSKSKRVGPKRKFGSTGPRPQKVQWRREDDRAYYEATYGWTSCWFCRECSCCCKCHGPAAYEIWDNTSDEDNENDEDAAQYLKSIPLPQISNGDNK